jgi:CheY-like chemotaxis protein
MARQDLVLVVDDEPDIAGLLVALLQSDGHRTAQTSSGNEALEMAARLRPAAVVLDLSLPDLDGVQVLRRMKGQQDTAVIPVIVVSAYTARLSAADRAHLHGMFEKPFDLDDLSETLASVLADQQKQRGPARARNTSPRASSPAFSA